MSADNGIYIAQFKDGKFRVIEAQAIENLSFFPAGSKESIDEFYAYFGNAQIFETFESAMMHAYKMEHEIRRGFGILEYGVSDLGFFDVELTPQKVLK